MSKNKLSFLVYIVFIKLIEKESKYIFENIFLKAQYRLCGRGKDYRQENI